MALQAGRVGVHPSQVDLLGKIKIDKFINLVLPWRKKNKSKWVEVIVETNEDGDITIVKGLNYFSLNGNNLMPLNINDYITSISLLGNIAADYQHIATYANIRSRQNGIGNYLALPSTGTRRLNAHAIFYIELTEYIYTEPVALLSDNQTVQSVRKVAKASKVEEPVEEPTEPIEEPINTDIEE